MMMVMMMVMVTAMAMAIAMAMAMAMAVGPEKEEARRGATVGMTREGIVIERDMQELTTENTPSVQESSYELLERKSRGFAWQRNPERHSKNYWES